MDKLPIFEKIKEARNILTSHQFQIANSKTDLDYCRTTQRYYKKVTNNSIDNYIPLPPEELIKVIRECNKRATARKYATSAIYYSRKTLKNTLKILDHARSINNYEFIQNVTSSKYFNRHLQIASMSPIDFLENWNPKLKRKGKKTSLRGLPEDWRNRMALVSKGQYRIPMLVTLLTGIRPCEIQKGVRLLLKQDGLYVLIKGGKVTEVSGQETRLFRLADHPITNELIKIMNETDNPEEMLVQAKNGNSLTTHMRNVAKKIWPQRKESITAYTARHGIAAACKLAVSNGADPLLTSKVLGHSASDTQTYYGTSSQAKSHEIAPSKAMVARNIRIKRTQKNTQSVKCNLKEIS